MGGNNTKEQADSIASSISKNIVNSISTVTITDKMVQEIHAICDASTHTDCVTKCMAAGLKANFKPDDYKNVCGSLCGCAIENINMKETLMLTSSGTQTSDINSAIKSSVTTTMDQYTSGPASLDAQAVSKAVTINSTNIQQAIHTSSEAVQIIDVGDTYISGITFDESITSVYNFIQTNKVIQSSINKLATTITQKSVDTMNNILYIGLIIILVFFLIFSIIMISKSKNITDFFNRIKLYIIWFILVTIITIVLVISKPSYVSYVLVDNSADKTRHLDYNKLFMWLFIYYVSFAVIIYSYNKISNKISRKS
jgi:hypothetical protein